MLRAHTHTLTCYACIGKVLDSISQSCSGQAPCSFSQACRQHQDCSWDLLYWSTVSIYFVKASLLSLPLSISIMHAHLSALLPNGRCLLGWHIMPEVLLAASHPRGNHCSGSRKSVNSARSSSPTVLRPLLLYGA